MVPDVSVIIPAYNAERYIHQAIESALNQTLKTIEVIVVDDGSTDKTEAIARSFVDPRLKVLTNSSNLGASAARNRALWEAQGTWVAVLDADDWYSPERLETLVKLADEEAADMIADDLYFIWDGESSPHSTLFQEVEKTIDRRKVVDAPYLAQMDAHGKGGVQLGFTKPLFKRKFLVDYKIRYNEAISIVQDFWIDIECLINGARFVLVPHPYYFYRLRLDSLSAVKPAKVWDEELEITLDFIHKQEANYQNPELVTALHKHLAFLRRYRAYYRVIELLRQRKLLTAAVSMVKNPQFFTCLLLRIPGIVKRRFNYLLFGTKFERL